MGVASTSGMPFCDVALACRIERAEQSLLVDAMTKVQERLPDCLGVPIAGGFAAYTEPGSPLNKVIGLGFAPFDAGAWELVEREYDCRKAPIQVEISTLADPAVARFLTTRGYQLVGVENVLGRSLTAPVDSLPSDVSIETSPAADLAHWLDLVVSGFLAPDTQGVASHESFAREVLLRIMGDFVAAAGVERFVARRGQEILGGGTMRRHLGIAQLCGASTLPAHRRTGVQSALLAHRLRHAAQNGCELAVVTTMPGSKSQQNMQRQGFVLLYSRNVLVREPG